MGQASKKGIKNKNSLSRNVSKEWVKHPKKRQKEKNIFSRNVSKELPPPAAK